MKRTRFFALAIVLSLFGSLGTCSVAAAQTHVYEFVAGESFVIQTGGIAGVHEEYAVTGQFQLTVDYDTGAARFDWVHAGLTEGPFLYTGSLDELFAMSRLEGKVVDSTTIQFTGPKNVSIVANLTGDSITLSGERICTVIDGFDYRLKAVALRLPPQWVYHYQDDFSTEKAAKDSYDHSVFWPADASEPLEPYLYYADYSGNPPPGLGFAGTEKMGAHLNYCFPLESAHGMRPVKGTLEFDVISLPLLSMPEPYGYLSYSLSADGRIWTLPTVAKEGHNSVGIGSGKGTCFVSFMGYARIIDNLTVHLISPATTIRVPQDYKTIQAAINAAVNGDVVEVSAGVYSGDGNRDIDFLGKAITVQSADGPEKTVVDCAPVIDGGAGQGEGTGSPESHRGFYFHLGERADSVLKGFTIRAGRIRGNDVPADTDIWDPSPKQSVGGGIYCADSGPTIVDCAIIDCTAEIGGGVCGVNSTASIVNCRIAECRAGGLSGMRSGGRGAGLAMLRKSNMAVVDSAIIGNSGYYNSLGGGMYIRSSSARVIGCEISSNTAEGSILGGGAYIAGAAAGVLLQNNVISNNQANAGAGVYAERGPLIALETKDAGTGSPDYIAAGVTIKNCTVAHNRLMSVMPPLPAGGIFSTGIDIRLANCIVWYNQGPDVSIIDPYSNSPVTYSNIGGDRPYPGPGNISEDPLFAPTGVPDYHLQSIVGRFDPTTGNWVIDNRSSPSIDAGDPDDAFGREPAPNGGRVNMGAYGNTEQASKSRGNQIWHVDVINGDDTGDGLTRKTALRHIQTAIARNTTVGGDTVLVWPGVYKEMIGFMGKAITLQSAADAAIIEAPGADAVTFQGEGPLSVLKNFVIRDSAMAIAVNGLSSPTITQLTIVDNEFGIAVYDTTVPEDPRPDISNCIFHNNGGDIYPSDLQTRHCIFTGMIMAPYVPLFADYANGDYHLLSTRGRYRASTDEWIIDRVNSIALDAGDPRIKPVREPMPNGGRLNAGAYGGTAYASMSEWPLANDRNFDGIVNIADLASMGQEWLDSLAWVNLRPWVRIVQPYDRSKIPYTKETIPIIAEASDDDGRVVRVEFFANNVRIGADTDARDGWSIPWWSYAVGAYDITARATDDTGASTMSRPIRIAVVNAINP
jgi:hypothetical protein